MHIYTYIGKWTTHNRDRKSLRNHKKSRPTAKGRRVRITKSTLLRSAKYDRWKFMQVNPEDVKLEEWRFRVGYERSPRQVVAGPLNAEGIARDRPTDRPVPPLAAACCSTLRHDDAIGSKWCSHEGGRPRFQRYCSNRAFNRAPGPLWE